MVQQIDLDDCLVVLTKTNVSGAKSVVRGSEAAVGEFLERCRKKCGSTGTTPR